MKEFFNTNHSKKILNDFQIIIGKLSPKSDFEKQRNSLILLVTRSMSEHPDDWDASCQININWIGDQFINTLSNPGKDLNKDSLDDIASMCFRFLLEFYLSIKNDLSMEFENAKNFVVHNLDSFEYSAKEQISYAIKSMPISIFKAISNSDSIQHFRDFNELSSKAHELKTKWDQELDSKEKKVNKLKESLKQYENGFNFVGLYQGFDELATEKNSEKRKTLFWLKFLSVLIFLPIIVELIVIYWHIDNIQTIQMGLLVSILPTISFVGIAIYYFRVLLYNYKSVKSQLLQIELRKTLCRFIQSYADYSQEIGNTDSNLLSKFENIIFSGIVTDEDKLPSSYDGIEQLSKLLQSLKP